MINIFKSMVRTILTYGSPVLLTAKQTVWDRLQIIQNEAMRVALGLPSYTSVEYIHRISNIYKSKGFDSKKKYINFNEIFFRFIFRYSI